MCQVIGGAILVLSSGKVQLQDSAFQSNWAMNGNESVGIANLGGSVRCDDAIGCLPLCTVCQRDDTTKPTPSPRPITMSPTTVESLRPTGAERQPEFWSASLVAICGLSSLAFAALCVGVARSRKLCNRHGLRDYRVLSTNEDESVTIVENDLTSLEHELTSLTPGSPMPLITPLLFNESEERPDPLEIMMQVHAAFYVDRNFRITSWSQGE